MLRSVTIAAAATLGLGIAAAGAAPLVSLRWNNRVLLIHAGAADDSRLAEEKRRIASAHAELADRDMVVIAQVGAAEPELLYGSAPKGAVASFRTAPAEPGFQIVLIGKDGGEKGRWSEPVAMNEVFGLIDAMPMRRAEAARKSG
ncbi:protein of unknown function [Faunimonas pinastri]|uniref:DUF4174 domain-containing protein n=1 Tax=Faunimonas pinastri TaxID=1855383 RepID=A0A1H9MC12_9HYPH|nr:DUF4174 domain-containing protein [Faunimonas pinastri]SER21238.1 protein of unknown function [Faunimonas pinastri]